MQYSEPGEGGEGVEYKGWERIGGVGVHTSSPGCGRLSEVSPPLAGLLLLPLLSPSMLRLVLLWCIFLML